MKIKQVEHHRNGVSGAPFYVVRFGGKKNMLSIIFDTADDLADYVERLTQKVKELQAEIAALKSANLRLTEQAQAGEEIRDSVKDLLTLLGAESKRTSRPWLLEALREIIEL